MTERAFIMRLTPQAIATEYERLVDVCRDAAAHFLPIYVDWRDIYAHLVETRTAEELFRIGEHYTHFPEGAKHAEVLDRE